MATRLNRSPWNRWWNGMCHQRSWSWSWRGCKKRKGFDKISDTCTVIVDVVDLVLTFMEWDSDSGG